MATGYRSTRGDLALEEESGPHNNQELGQKPIVTRLAPTPTALPRSIDDIYPQSIDVYDDLSQIVKHSNGRPGMTPGCKAPRLGKPSASRRQREVGDDARMRTTKRISGAIDPPCRVDRHPLAA